MIASSPASPSAARVPVEPRPRPARTDAERVVEGFRVRTRDEVDLRRLHDAVVATTADAVHPDGAALWLRRTR